MSSFGSDPIQQRISTSLRQTIRRINKDADGLREIMNSHYLKGTFVQLCNPHQMQELLYPGASNEVLQNLPKNLKEVLEWSDLQLDMEKITRNAAEVLRNIKIKGAKQGNHMDDATERVLLPQIAQEALSKGIIEAVRKLNLKVSGTIAKIARPVAAPESERARRNALDEEVLKDYLNHQFAIQREYVGDDWCAVIRNDMRRFASGEKMTFLNDKGEVHVKDSDARVEELTPHSSMAWIEKDDRTQEVYPALYELIDQIQSLPYELNARCDFKYMSLLEPGKGCTMFLHFPAGSNQKVRLDNRGGEFDSGIRITCTFHIKCPPVISTAIASNSAKILLQPKSEPNTSKSEIILENDMLILHSSTDLKNERTVDGSQDWFALVFFAHGKDTES